MRPLGSSHIFLLLFFAAVWALLCPCLAAAQDQETSAIDLQAIALKDPIDFSSPTEPNVQGVEQVIAGKLVLRGKTTVDMLQLIRTVAISCLMQICENRSVPVTATIVQSILTINSNRPLFIMDWQMLPPIGGGQYCMDSISEYGYGHSEPPYDPVVGPPPIRQALQMEFRRYKETYLLDLTDWQIFLGNHTCNYNNTIAPVERATTKWTTTKAPGASSEEVLPACADGDSLMPGWVPPDQRADPEDTTTCAYATTPCGCATMRASCVWVKSSAGAWCEPGSFWEMVSCEDCSFQADCPSSSSQLCGGILLPCGCVKSVDDCRWDDASQACVPRSGGAPTSCQACTAQTFCSAPRLVSLNPPYHPQDYHILGNDYGQDGWLINVSFDREMAIYDSAKSGAQLWCRTILESDYNVFEVSRTSIRMSNNTNLQIDVSMVLNDKMRECELVIPDDLLHDSDYVFFEGAGIGTLIFILPDTVVPDLTTFDPPNSDTGVTIGKSVSLNFTEAVKAASATSIIPLTALGAGWDGGSEGADVLVAEISLRGVRCRYSSSDSSLVLDLSGLLERGVLYTLELEVGALTDMSGNPFGGLVGGIYQFRTSTSEDDEVEGEAEWYTVEFWVDHPVLLAVVAVGLGTLGAAGGCWWHIRQTKRQHRVWALKAASAAAAAEDVSKAIVIGEPNIVAKTRTAQLEQNPSLPIPCRINLSDCRPAPSATSPTNRSACSSPKMAWHGPRPASLQSLETDEPSSSSISSPSSLKSSNRSLRRTQTSPGLSPAGSNSPLRRGLSSSQKSVVPRPSQRSVESPPGLRIAGHGDTLRSLGAAISEPSPAHWAPSSYCTLTPVTTSSPSRRSKMTLW